MWPGKGRSERRTTYFGLGSLGSNELHSPRGPWLCVTVLKCEPARGALFPQMYPHQGSLLGHRPCIPPSLLASQAQRPGPPAHKALASEPRRGLNFWPLPQGPATY